MSFCNNNLDSKIGTVRKSEGTIKKVEEKIEEAKEHYSNSNFREAVKSILEISSIGNQYFQESQPWHTIKKDRKKCETTVATAANIVKNISILLAPIVPEYAEKIQKQLGIENQTFSNLGFNLENHGINKARIIFSRIEGDIFRIKTFPIMLRVARIESVQEHPNADKLYILKVSLGDEKRQIVAGLRNSYKKEELEGKKIVMVCNLKPAVIRGEKSEGMLLAADDGNNLKVLDAHNSSEGDSVSIEGYVQTSDEITFEDFMKVKLTTKGRKAVFNNMPLKTPKGEITADVGDNARIR